MGNPRAAVLTSRRSFHDRAASAPRGLFSTPAPIVAIVPVAVAIFVALFFVYLGEPRVTGDEPHYLVMADAIVHDHTFDLRDAYTRESQTQRIYGSPLPAPHVLIVNHRWGPYHEPGLPILLALPFLAGHVLGARVALCLFAGLLPLCAFRWLRERMPSEKAAALTIGLTVGVPISFGASQIYPDLPAGIVATGLMLWLVADRDHRAAWQWAGFWLTAGLLPWLNLKFVATTAALLAAALVVEWREWRRPGHRRSSAMFATIALLLVGPLTLGLFHMWASGSAMGLRGAAELTTSPGRAAMMLLGLHLDQAQGMFWQQPLLLLGVAAFVPFARRSPAIALVWLGVYASLIMPDALELARYGGGAPAGRFAWSAAWLWIVPIGFVFEQASGARQRFVKPIVCAGVAYQALLAIRWLPDPHVLFPVLEENLALRDSLFPVALRGWLPSFYFWDFSSYWTYGPNVAAYAVLAVLLLSGAAVFRVQPPPQPLSLAINPTPRQPTQES